MYGWIKHRYYGWRMVPGMGAAAADPYVFPTDGAVETWTFNQESGDVVSNILGRTYTKTDPSSYFSYEYSGPNDLVGILHANSGSTGTFRLLSQPDADFDWGAGENLTFVFQIYYNNTNNANRTFFDFGTENLSSTGIWIGTSGDKVDVWTRTTAANNATRGTYALVDGTFYTITLRFDRSLAKVRIFIKEEGNTEFEDTTSQIFSALSSCGALTLNGSNFSFSRGSNNTGEPMWGAYYQAAFAKGLTYDVPSKP